MTNHSPLKQAVSTVLRDREVDDLDAWLATEREQGASWRQVAVRLYDLTGVSVTHETLRSWAREPADREPAA